MMTVRNYRERAEESEQLARETSSERQRQEFLRIAASWRKLAGEYGAPAAGADGPRRDPIESAATVCPQDNDQGCDEQGGKDAERQYREGRRGQ